MRKIGVCSDDLTGAMTSGVLLARSGASPVVFFDEDALSRLEADHAPDCILVSTDSRAAGPEKAYSVVKRATEKLKELGTVYFSKRIDTTLRGSIGSEIDAMLDVMGSDAAAVVMPSMPQSRRILVGGYSVIDGTVLTNTQAAKDVRTPVTESYIPALLAAQTTRKTDSLKLGTVLCGPEAVKEELERLYAQGVRVIIADAISMEDVSVVASACTKVSWDVLAVDPGPFTQMMAYHRGLVGEEHDCKPEDLKEEPKKCVLCMAGSATSVTRKQMETFLETPGTFRVSISASALIGEEQAASEEIRQTIHKVQSLLTGEKLPKAIVLETALHGERLNLDEEDQKRNCPSGWASGTINEGLGEIARGILEQSREKIAGLYCTGGDTEVYVCKALGVRSLRVMDYVIPQTDVGKLTGEYEGMPIIGKGGLTGHDEIVSEIVDRILCEAGEN